MNDAEKRKELVGLVVDQLDFLMTHNENLKSENTSLKNQIISYVPSLPVNHIIALIENNTELENENIKLRKIMKNIIDMFPAKTDLLSNIKKCADNVAMWPEWKKVEGLVDGDYIQREK